MDSSEKKKLEEIYQLFSGLEKDSADGLFDNQLLEQLIFCIESLSQSTDPILKKLSTYTKHLTTQMTLKHFSTIAVPFERALKKSVQDDDFLVSSHDRDHLVTPRVPLHFVVDNMRSAFNVGSLFRTADTLGAQKIWLCGYTPTPHQVQVEKAALGASYVIPWETTTFSEAISKLKAEGFQIIGLETTAKSLIMSAPFESKKPTAFVIGNERFGLEVDQLALCDEVRKIETFGIKNSLNAGVAAAIAGYEWRRQWNEANAISS
ncbi:MAG: TrmH family RNA methyltransferase [Pseudobdellovibrio sp.]